MNIYYQIRYYFGRQKKKVQEIKDFLFLKSVTQEISIFKNHYKGKRCFVIGNGPSLNTMDLNLMKDDVVFCSNSFFLKFSDLDFKPDFLTVEDHLVAEDNRHELENLHGITKIFPLDLRHVLRCEKNTYWVEFRRAWLNKTNSDEFKFNIKNETFFWGGTVLYMNLQLAAYMGFKEIYLIGVDLSYKIPDDALIAGSVITSNSDDPNHFNSAYFGAGKRWHLPETDRMQNSFSNAHASLAENGIFLFNATRGGNLKNVPRVDYNSLFK